MSISNIHQLRATIQDTRKGVFTVTGIALTNLLQTLIREYGTYKDGSIYINSDEFTLSEKKLLLSYFVDPEEYEYACTKTIRLETIYSEYQHPIQIMLDDECSTVYHEIMQEQGAVSYRNRDNGEMSWRMR